MAGEIQLPFPATALTLYALVRNAVGQVWQTTSGTFVTYVTANLGNYDIALVEQGTASRYYVGDMPAAATGTYRISVYVQAGGSPAEGDTLAGSGSIEWSGTVTVPLDSRTKPADTQARCSLVDVLTTYSGNTVQTGDSFARIGAAGVGLTNVVLPAGGLANVTAWTVAITGNITGNLSGSVGSVTAITTSGGKVSGVILVDTLTTYTGNTPQTGDSYPFVSDPFTGTTAIAFAVAAVDTKVDNVPTVAEFEARTIVSASYATAANLGTLITTVGAAGAGLSAVPWNASWDAEVQSECADALNAYDGPTNAEMEARTIVAASYATAANQTTINNNVVAIPAAVSAVIITDHGTGSYIRNTEPNNTGIAAIQTKTDQLTFSVANVMDSNVLYVHSQIIDGTGTDADPWGP